MAKVFDVMSSDISVAGTSEFVVDNTVAEVAVLGPGVPGLPFSDANGNEWFELGDNIQITEFLVNIPYGFGQGTGKASIGLVWEDAGGFSVIIPEFAGNSVVTLPNLCALEIPGGLFIAAPTSGGRHRLQLTNLVLSLSQLNAPALINGQTLKVQFHIQITHTLPLVAAP